MGFLGDITLGGVKGLMEGAGSLAKDLRSAITGEIGPEQKAVIELKLTEIEALSQQAQIEVNKIEAQHPNIFVSGWRPFVGWICGIGVFYHFIGFSLLQWTVAIFKLNIVPPSLETEGLLTLIFALLGVGSMRTFEKLKGAARN